MKFQCHKKSEGRKKERARETDRWFLNQAGEIKLKRLSESRIQDICPCRLGCMNCI